MKVSERSIVIGGQTHLISEVKPEEIQKIKDWADRIVARAPGRGMIELTRDEVREMFEHLASVLNVPAEAPLRYFHGDVIPACAFLTKLCADYNAAKADHDFEQLPWLSRLPQ